MKKLISVIVLLGMAMAVTGCSASSEPPEVSDIGSTVSQTKMEESAVISTAEDNTDIAPLADFAPDMAAIVAENTQSIELTDEQTEIVTELFDTFAKMDLLFFNSNYECKNALDIFNDTEYACARVFADSRPIRASFPLTNSVNCCCKSSWRSGLLFTLVLLPLHPAKIAMAASAAIYFFIVIVVCLSLQI